MAKANNSLIQKTFIYSIKFLWAALPIIALYFFLKLNIDFNKITWTLYVYIILSLSALYIENRFFKQHFSIIYWSFVLILSFFLLRLRPGLDLTDETYSLALSWFYPLKNNFLTSTNPVAYKLSHIWLAIIGKPYFLWERLLRDILLTTEITLVLWWLTKNDRNIPNWLIFLVGFSSASISFNWIRFLIPYDHFHILFFILLIISLEKTQEKSVFAIISGILSVFWVYSRTTILPFAVAFIVIYALIKKLNFYIQFLIGLILGLVILSLMNINLLELIKAYFNHKISTDLCITLFGHDYSSLIDFYLKETIYILLFSLIFGSIFLINHELISKDFKTIISFNIIIFSILFATFNFNFARNYYNWFYAAFTLILVFLVFNFMHTKNFIYLLISLIAMASSFLGSDNGMRKIFFSGSINLILPLIILTLPPQILKKFKSLIITASLFLFFIGLDVNFSTTYRDYTPITQLNKTFHSGILNGIRTNERKVYEIDSFYKLIKNIKIDNQYITTHKTFIFSLLLYSEKPYQICWLISPDKFENSIKQKNQPKYVFFSNRCLRYKDWDKRKVFSKPSEYYINLKTKKLLDSLYQPIAISPNKIFMLYKLKSTFENKHKTQEQ